MKTKQPKHMYIYQQPDYLMWIVSTDKKALVKKAVEWADKAPECADVYSDLPGVECLKWNDEIKGYSSKDSYGDSDFTAHDYFENKYHTQRMKAKSIIGIVDKFKDKLEKLIEEFENELEGDK